MRILFAVIGVLGALSVHARAEPATVADAVETSAPETAEAPPARFAVAVNTPLLGWAIGSFGGSAYARIGEHLAVRGNVATYRNGASIGEILGGLSGNDGTGHGGNIFDTGIAAVWYPRRAWDGLLLEVGALRRDRDTYVWPEFEEKTFTRSTEYAGRALVGWSWLIHQRSFIAVAAGLSVGRESGEDTTTENHGTMTITESVRRTRRDFEGYIRVGLVFGD